MRIDRKEITFTVDNCKFDIDKLKEIAAHNPNFKIVDLRDCADDAGRSCQFDEQ